MEDGELFNPWPEGYSMPSYLLTARERVESGSSEAAEVTEATKEKRPKVPLGYNKEKLLRRLALGDEPIPEGRTLEDVTAPVEQERSQAGNFGEGVPADATVHPDELVEGRRVRDWIAMERRMREDRSRSLQRPLGPFRY